jgi:hypothetical protein
MSLTHRFLKNTRTLHLYLGVFTAPMLLFFAVTGGLQSFSLHETTRGSSYEPPAWLASAAHFHKKQTTVMPARRRPPPEATAAANLRVDAETARPAESRPSQREAGRSGVQPERNLAPMKAFFALVALSLLLSVLSGLYMAWRYSRKPALFGTVLLTGVAVPLLLMLF